MNYKDLQDEYDEEMQYNFEDDDFEQMMMLQDEESQTKLDLNRKKSAYVKVSFPDFISNDSK